VRGADLDGYTQCHFFAGIGGWPLDRVPRSTGVWSDYELVWCADGKARRVESGVAPLAARVPGDLVRLRAYGNAISPPLAAEFVAAYMEVRHAG